MGKSKKGRKKTAKQKSLTERLKKSMFLIILISVLVIFVAYYNLPDWTYYLVSATRLWIASDEIQSAYADMENFDNSLQSVEKRYDSNIEIYSADGKFIYSTLDADTSYPEDPDNAPSVDEKYRLTYETTEGQISAGKRGFLIKIYNSGGINVDFLVCYDYLPGGERIEICMQVSQVVTTGQIDFVITFSSILMALMIAYFVFLIYLKKFTKPITNLCKITDRMSQLDFSEKCPPTKITEMTQLSESINLLSDSLDTSLKDLQNKNEKLLQDIENEKTIDNLRQTFISGISHELKTPIAIIQGYAEGAKLFYEAGDPEKAAEYCDTISSEAIRMNNMVMKLLEITKYSSGAYEPQREDFSIREMVEDWYTRNVSITGEKGVSMINDVDSEFIGNGDTIILASVLNNYLSNALSHVDGDRVIRCFAEETPEGRYRLFVRNTGKQIAEKDIDKIWTSFYRADKSLSRSQGRFGLGLAIVASIQKLHGEEYGVQNEEDGVSFWFDIKKAE